MAMAGVMRLLSIAALLSGVVAAGSAAAGLTLSVYNNSAWYGTPLTTKVVSSFDQSLAIAGASPFTVEITGSLTFDPSTKPCFENDHGCYTFNCSFGAATYGFLWSASRAVAVSY